MVLDAQFKQAVEAGTVLAIYGAPIQPKIPVVRISIPLQTLKVGRKGGIYDVKIDVSDLDREKAEKALTELVKGLKEKFGATTLYAAATKNTIFLEIKGSPFSWIALLTWLPLILGMLGIILFGVSVWQAIAAIPSWVWATLIIGGALMIFGPTIGEWILAQVEKR